MLIHLFVKNFAIIDDMQINFSKGFNIITGESGAGKSIIIKALSLLTGDRADKSFIKTDCESAIISAEFEDLNTKTTDFLEQHSFGSECLIRRVIDKNGKSKVFINDNPTSLNLLKKLANLLIDISSQNSHQLLLDNKQQRQILDDYAGNTKLLQNINTTYTQLNQIKQQIDEIKNNENHNQLDFLKFQLAEFKELNLNQDELTTIEEDYNQANNYKNLSQDILTISHYLNNIDKEITTTYELLSKAQHTDNKLNNAYELLESSKINLTECSYEVSNYLNNLEAINIDDLEQKIGVLYDLARKHHCQIDELLNKQNEIQEQVNAIENTESTVLALEKQYQESLSKYHNLSQKLSKNRKEFAQKLDTQITQTMQKFAMPYAEFKVDIQTDLEKISAYGSDEISFLINTSGDFKPLKKIASGGELSRINLALAVISSSNAYTPALVFDEVDSGISGEVAKVVAKELQILSKNYQVLCITHLPQVASKSDTHILIGKTQTGSTIEYLEASNKLKVIAQMIAGEKISETTLNLAQEMIDA